MPTITNNANIELAPAVWLLQDDYDYSSDSYTISATTLLQPIRSIILGVQNAGNESGTPIDLVDMIAARMGTALHDSLESCWKNPKHVVKALKALGLGKLSERLLINPEPQELEAWAELYPPIVIYIENRSSKSLGKWTITGKYDLVMDGQVEDYKSTSVWGYIFGSNDQNYALQGSIYRWLNPTKIIESNLLIHYLFTDWSKAKAIQDPKYPQTRILSKKIPLFSIEETEKFIQHKLDLLDELIDADQAQLPFCTPNELWQREAVWKYYKAGDTTKRATKVFDNQLEAEQLQSQNGCGVVKQFSGEVVRCKYCSSMSICDQAQEFLQSGLIKL